MARCVTYVSFQQIEKNGDGRNLAFTFDFVNEYEGSDTWVDLTNQLKLTFPKNIYVKDANGNLIPLSGTNNQINTLFQRGDKVALNYGYYTYNEAGIEHLDMPDAPVFQGYISKVTSKKPIVLECEDNMWLLKQIPCKPQVWSKNKTVEDLLKLLLQGTEFTVNALTSTTIGDFIVNNESVAQLLARLRKEYHLEAYFRGDELRIGSVVYIESEANTHNFIFQQNIISDELDFQRRDDVKLSAVCNSINTVDGGTNKQGETKTKQERLSVLVYSDAMSGNFKYIVKKKGEDFPANEEGERRTLFYPNVKTAQELAQLGADELQKFFYTGFKGSFTTFGIPYVNQGDNVRIKDPVLPDRNGLYKVKSVNYSGGVKGTRQKITVHYKMVEVNGQVQPISPPAIVTPA